MFFSCREEAIVMANLRKRVAACDLTRKRATPTPEDQNANESEQTEQLDNRPLLPKVKFITYTQCLFTKP